MAGRGPAPKDPAKRRSGGGDNVPRTQVFADGELRGPELPDGTPWHPQTVAWWETWRSAPQAQAFTQTDWDFLVDTALLHTAMWLGDSKAAPEVRLRVAKFGATIEDRARLRLDVETPAERRDREVAAKAAVSSGKVTAINSRRARLTES